VDILRNWRYVLVAITMSIAVFLLVLWFPNRVLLFSLWTDSSASLGDKVRLPVSLLSALGTNFSPLSAAYTVVIVALIGINTALIIYLLRARGAIAGGLFAGLSGMSSGILGVGCAACGSLILMWLLSVAGGVSVLSLLPLRGGEFGVLGVILLGYSTYILLKQVIRPPVCEIDTSNNSN